VGVLSIPRIYESNYRRRAIVFCLLTILTGGKCYFSSAWIVEVRVPATVTSEIKDKNKNTFVPKDHEQSMYKKKKEKLMYDCSYNDEN